MTHARLKMLFFVLCAVVVLIAIIAVIKPLLKPASFDINVNRAAVIKQVRSLARLETASFTIEKVIDAKTNDSNAISRFLFGDKILLIAHGQVIAGLDLSQFSGRDITIEGRTVTVTLPAAQILVATLDNSQTKVYDRSQGLLRRNDTELESAVRQAAEKSIRQAACDGNILVTASDNAKRQVSSLLTGLGFETITVKIPPSKCQ
ncbi:DUF4230 domain-containing protein [Candidatus Microgenomates bacterium]|nr:DUF4230 domain-containing protein [Candidatus Microgenomates bacterium]